MKTRLTELLGIRYPIVQGGMQWVGYAELASAVSNAGGLGILTALTQPTPEDLHREIARCREMTDKPFGVNLTILPSIKPPPYAEYMQVIFESGIKIVETAGNNPRDFAPKFKEMGITILHKCTSLRHALSAEKHGVDVISIDGFECAGHPGEDDVTNLILIPAAVRACKIPVIASGGIADGYQMAACLAMGAQGVNMGTRFMVTKEAPIHDRVKAALVAASERDTNLIFRTMHNTSRVFKNAVSDEVVAMEKKGAAFEDIRHLVAGARGKVAVKTGEIDEGIVSAGMVIGLIKDVPSCAELLERMVRECREALASASAMAH
ncbi:MAG: nitronate monooxygenase [Burkholderiales bacterium]|nr:nitronate monooxygenase [Burkholderiales bacterium]